MSEKNEETQQTPSTEETQTVAQPVTTDPDQAKGSVEGLPLPQSNNVSDEPGKSPSDVNKDTSGAGPSQSDVGSTPDVSTTAENS